MPNLTINAQKENLDSVIEFINKELIKFECDEQLRTRIDIAIEEIFVNISSYAYDETGKVDIKCDVEKNNSLMVNIEFSDTGKPYNPLERPDPDIDMPVEKRKIGGLGIFMTKKLMEEVRYEYKDGKNILTIRNKIYKEEEF